MKVLVIGSGGREDALVWKISQSDLVSQIYCTPGNAGIGQRPKTNCLAKLKATDLWGLRDFAKGNKIDLTVVGPEAPLVAGIVDEFEAMGLKIVGPTKRAAEIEGSKVWAKKFMERYGIPTAHFMTFTKDEVEKARKYAEVTLPCVIKADGLAAGKGSIPCQTREEAWAVIDQMMVKKEFGDAGNQIVIEEFLKGEEATFKVLTDSQRAIPLLATQDHKPVYDGDQGPNTGGMGAYAPAPVIGKELEKEIMETIVEPVLAGMREELRPYKGCLYLGLMITPDGPKVLEFNCRFGDPELQPIVLLMESDIVPVLMDFWRQLHDRQVMKLVPPTELIVLLGYMWWFSKEMCQKKTAINLHPALPTGPKGNYRDVIWQLIKDRATETGVMMHLVTPELDRSQAIAFCRFSIQGGEFDLLWQEMEERLKKESLEEIAEREGENNSLFAAIRRKGVRREFPMVIETIRAIAEGKAKTEGSGYDLTKEIDAAIKEKEV